MLCLAELLRELQRFSPGAVKEDYFDEAKTGTMHTLYTPFVLNFRAFPS